MMQLLCNGERLDLPTGASLQFTHKNPLFAFDSMEVERTTSFKLPATPTNDRVLELARVPAFAGTGMRVRFAAQVIDGVVVKDGYLYISEWNGEEYEAIFVCGELLGLQAIKNAGKIADIIGDTKQFAFWGNQPSGVPQFFAPVGYQARAHSEDYPSAMIPSFKLADLVTSALTSLGVTHEAISGTWRVLLKDPKTPTGNVEATLTYADGYASSYITNNYLYSINATTDNSATASLDVVAAKIRYAADNYPHYMYGWIRQFESLYNDINLVFPDDFDDDIFLLSFPTNCAEDPHDDPDVYKPGGAELSFTLGVFLGDYSFNIDFQTGTLTPVGEPLAGRTITIPKSTPFCLLSKSSFEYYPNNSKGWYTFLPYSADWAFTIGEDKAVPSNRIALFNNLPDVTLTDLLKTIAAIQGKVLNYDDAHGVTFDDLDFSTWVVKDLTNMLTKRSNVARTFADYAQENVVSFKGDDTQIESDHLTRVYTISNDNIEETKDLQTIPFSEGSVNAPSTLLYLRNSADELAPKEFVLAGLNAKYALERITLPLCAGVQSLCTASTQYKVQVSMRLMDYDMLTAKTLLLIDGVKYVWTERSWQNGVATFTLAKIA